MNLSQRIKAIVDHSGLSIPKYAQAIGAQTPQAIRDLISGKTKSLSADMQNKILSYSSKINPSWLFTGEGEMLNTPDSNAKMLGGVYSASEGDEGVVMVNYVPGTATASFIEYVDSGNLELERIAVLKQYGETLDDTYTVFEVIGESMSPAIPNRAKILTKLLPESKWEQAEGVVVVSYSDEVVVKRIINNDIAINNSLVLSSDNPKFGERRVAVADIRAIFKAIRIVSADIL